MQAIVHPSFDPYYYGFYIEGLRRVLGRASIQFDERGFPSRTSHGDFYHRKDMFAFRLVDGRQHRNIYLSADDMKTISSAGLEWCDLYPKVNLAQQDADHPKLMPIGPSFGVRGWSRREALWRALQVLRTSSIPFAHRRYYAREYRRQRTRLAESEYHWSASDPNFLFFAAWAWKKHAGINEQRAKYVRVARALEGVSFEGGFAPRRRNDIPELAGLYAEAMYAHEDYMTFTRRSFAVFNTPAVHDCLGWKLGEFMALGKAIVSLPLTRNMPGVVEHGQNIHFVEPEEGAIREGLERIRADESYRKRLERGALRYYRTFLAPESVVRRIIERAFLGEID